MAISRNQLARFSHITQLIISDQGLHQTLKQVVNAISEDIVQCNSVGIYLPQADGSFRGFVGKPDIINGVTLDQMVINPSTDLLAQEIIETNVPIYVPDTSVDNRPDPVPVEMFSIKSLLGVPISFEGDLFGLLFLFNSGFVLQLHEAEIRSIEAYVNIAALAIRNLYLTTQKQLLLDATRALSICTTTQAVIDTCFSYMERAVFNSNIGIHVSDGKGNFIPAQLSKNSSWTENEWKHVHHEMNIDFTKDLVFQEVVRTKRPIFIPDVDEDPRPNKQACKLFGINSLFITPLVAMGDVLGVVAIVHLGAKGYYAQSELLLAESITNATASALSNLFRMERLEQMVQERTEEIHVKNLELEHMIQRLEHLGHQNDLILNTVAEGIYGLDTDGKITFCNLSAAEMIGTNVSDVIGKNENEVFHQRIVLLQDYLKFPQKYPVVNTTLMSDALLRMDGSHFLVDTSRTSIIENEVVVGEVVTIKDVTQRKILEMAIEHQAFYDTLTGLPNRNLFHEELNAALKRSEELDQQAAVMFLDLDQFKIINDTLGHGQGDHVLKEVASRLSHCLRTSDVVSRLGGDEFTILLYPISEEKQIHHIAQRIMAELDKPFTMNHHEFYVKPSIGISLYPRDGQDAETLIMHADEAMYHTKQFSRNYEFYEPSMTNQMMSRISLEREYQKALDKKEFVLVYQPQVDIKSGKIVSMEALIRWLSPQKGTLLPAQFIPRIEQTGMIVPLEEWVIHTACAQGKVWHTANFPVRVSVNLSASHFDNPHLVDTIVRILEETEFAPTFLELELTESIVLHNSVHVASTMTRLNDMGVNISMDDFGTGYSSLAYLRKFPIRSLKIDKMFMDNIPLHSRNVAITSAIITLAHNLGLKSVAEGVETKEQLAFLQERGCDEAQGYFYSTPLPGEEATELLQRMNAN